VLFLLCWFVLTLAPSLLVILRRSASALVADRYLYLPSVGAVILVGWILTNLRPLHSRRWRLGAGAVAGVVAVGLAASVARTRVWSDDLSFWSDVAGRSPSYALPLRELGDAHMRRNQLDQAQTAYERALTAKSHPEELVMTYNNLGNLYLRRGRLDDAARVFAAGAELYPHPYLHNGLGRVAMRRAEVAQAKGDQAEVLRQVMNARATLEKALDADPNDHKSHVLLGQVLLSLGNRVEARKHFEAALAIEPAGSIADVAREFLASF